MTGGEPPDSWPAWGELVGIAAVGFMCGVVVGYVRAPRAQRKAVNQVVAQMMNDRAWELYQCTRTVLAVLKVRTLWDDDEVEVELVDGDFVQEATVLGDYPAGLLPRQEERAAARRALQIPDEIKSKAF